MKKIRLATVFSGIGAVEFALKRLNIPYEIVFACDNGERDVIFNKEEEFNNIKKINSIVEKHDYVDNLYAKLTRKTNFVEKSYLANYNCPKDRFYQDINLLDGNDFCGKIDLFVGGSPCQSFSSVGFQFGLDDARGTLFFEYARLIKEIQPEVFIYENVRNLLNHDNGNTWEIIRKIFVSLGYSFYFDVLNASDFNIPQTRRRLFVIGFKNHNANELNIRKKMLSFKMRDFLIDECSEGNFLFNSKGNISIRKNNGVVKKDYFLTPALYKYVMSTGTKNWHSRIEINKEIARTLLKTMGNHHRAGVDNYVSTDLSTDLGKVRILTEREALRLMGYTDDYKIVVSKSQTYKQAGNSIVVDVMMGVLKAIFEIVKEWGYDYVS